VLPVILDETLASVHLSSVVLAAADTLNDAAAMWRHGQTFLQQLVNHCRPDWE